MMLRSVVQWLAIWAILLVFPRGIRAEEAVSPPAPGPSLLLLGNGQILHGTIDKKDDLYVVTVPNGQIRIKSSDVDMICASMDDAYQRKRAKIPAGDVARHLELAQWCLRHRLLEQAADELTEAAAADPKNPQVGSLQNRLEIAKTPPPVAAAKPSQPAVTNEELDRLIRYLPRGSVETFTQSVQPLLMTHCMASGCHSPRPEDPLPLARISTKNMVGRRLTQRNLHAVLQSIDCDNPAESRLLKAIRSPHGGLQTPIFPERQALQYQRIADWVNMFASRPTAADPTMADQQPSYSVPSSPSGASFPAPNVLSRESQKAQPIRADGNHPGRQNDPSRASRQTDRPDEALPTSHQQPADPFDPEIFNSGAAAKK